MMSIDLTKLAFASMVNYLKRSPYEGSTLLTLTADFTPATHTVRHNLGYVPFFQVGSEIVGTDILWSNNYIHEYTESISAPWDMPVQLKFWCTDRALTIQLINGWEAGYETGDRRVWWILYKDYGHGVNQ